MLREVVWLGTCSEYHREILNNCRWGAGGKILLKSINLGMLRRHLLANFRYLELIFGVCFLQALQSVCFPGCMGFHIYLIPFMRLCNFLCMFFLGARYKFPDTRQFRWKISLLNRWGFSHC